MSRTNVCMNELCCISRNCFKSDSVIQTYKKEKTKDDDERMNLLETSVVESGREGVFTFSVTSAVTKTIFCISLWNTIILDPGSLHKL